MRCLSACKEEGVFLQGETNPRMTEFVQLDEFTAAYAHDYPLDMAGLRELTYAT
jgi:hypothetical protein